jgi:phage regulator Rha-like protein
MQYKRARSIKSKAIIPVNLIEQRIFIIRGVKVMIDRDIAELYGAETKYLNRQVRRNRDRFPHEFVFRLTKKEKEELVTNWHRFELLKHSTALPYAFTEHGVAMLATVLKSQQAVHMSILIVKTFVRLREILTSHRELAEKLQLLETRIDTHDQKIKSIIDTIHQLLLPNEKPKRQIGFRVSETKAEYKTGKRRVRS